MAPASAGSEPEIQVIPDKFYGAALKAHVPDAAAVKTPEPHIAQPVHSRAPLLIGLIVLVVVLLGGVGAYLYIAQHTPTPVKTVTPPPVVVQTPPPAPVQPPSAATNVAATSTSPQSVSLAWTDTATDETGYRIDRSDATGSFVSLTSLAAHSTAFVDSSVTASATYQYKVVVVNAGGETASDPISVTVQGLPPVPPEQPKLPPAGLDTDSDGLTDLEEALFKSNPRNPDSDADGFLDGNEVFNLYNPNLKAPSTLSDVGLVKPYTGTVGWKMQIPVAWTVSMDAFDGSQMTIVTGHNELFHFSVEANPDHLSTLNWYLKQHPEVTADQVSDYRTKRGYEGVLGADQLTTYLPWGDKIVVFSYDLGGQTFINFRTTYAMMLNSLQLDGLQSATSAKSQAPLPFEPAATTTGVIAQPVPVAPGESSSTFGGSATESAAPFTTSSTP